MKFTPITDWIDILMSCLVFVQVIACVWFVAWLCWRSRRQRRERWRFSGSAIVTHLRTRR